MAQNSEQIESKLCAYIEGELDERGRAEIEKHLQANPHHRKLLAELGETRRMMQALPRESAPPELYEAFQSQLERSVLLDYNDGRDEPAAYRTNRFPQVFAAAAIVMLAVGLGLIVYFALPITTTRTEIVSDGPSLSTAPVLGGESAVVPPWTPEERDPRHRGSGMARESEALTAATPGGSSSSATSTSDKLGGGNDPLSPGSVTPTPGTTLPADAPRLPVVAEQLRSVAGGGSGGGLFAAGSLPADGSSPEPVVVVVSALDPVAADSTLRRALTRIPDATWADATPTRRAPSLTIADLDATPEQQQSEKTEFAAGLEPAARHRMLRQANDVLLRGTGERDVPSVRASASAAAAGNAGSAPAIGARDAADAPAYAGRAGARPDAEPATAPAAAVDRKRGALAPAPAPGASATPAPAPGSAPASPSAVAVAPAPGNGATTGAAKKDEWALDGGFKESTAAAPKAAADDPSRSLAESEHSAAPAPTPPTDLAATVPGGTPAPAAQGATLSDAYRVIVAQNVPRSQVEALRRELGGEAVEQRQVAVYDAKSDRLKDAVVVDAPAAVPGAPAAGLAAASGDEKAQAPAAAGELAKQEMAPAAGAARHEENKKAGESNAPTTAASPTPPGTPTRVTTATPAIAPRLDLSKDRTVRVGDTLRVSVASAEAGKPPVEQDVRIAEDGTLTLAQAGEAVYSDGLTVAELERHLETTIARGKSAAPAPSASAPAPLGARNAQPAARVAASAAPRVSIATVAAPAAAPQQVAQMPARPEEPLSKAADAVQPPAAAKPTAPPAVPAQPDPAFGTDGTLPLRGPDASEPAASEPAAAEGEQRVEVVFVVRQAPPAADAPAPASGPAPPTDAAIENSEILTVTVEDPANPSTTNVRVADDGTVDVPLAGKVKAVGKTTGQLESDIEARWRESKASVAPGTKAKVARPADDAAATPTPALEASPTKQ